MILLTSKTVLVKDVLNKTKAKFFKDLTVGDKIVLSTHIKHTGHNKIYATYITIKNLNNNCSTQLSFSQLSNILKCFEIEEIDA